MPDISFIIPLYNRPEEIDELLMSLTLLPEKDNFEVIIVEDGSSNPAKNIVASYQTTLKPKYLVKENSGPGPTRNYGAQQALGEWLIFLDSDCTVPLHYITAINKALSTNESFEVFGGPDKAHPSFTPIQKAINYSMISFITTGGIRGGKKQLENFKPRSFNMGIKKSVFDKIGGFRNLRFGEDIDLSIRLASKHHRSILIEEAFVYHKRRSTFRQFFKQVFNSGRARIHLSQLHPGSMKLVHTFPAFFVGFLVLSLGLSFYTYGFSTLPLAFLLLIIFTESSMENKSVKVGFLSIISSLIQLTGYGVGFIVSAFSIYILGKKPGFSFEKTFYD